MQSRQSQDSNGLEKVILTIAFIPDLDQNIQGLFFEQVSLWFHSPNSVDVGIDDYITELLVTWNGSLHKRRY